MSRKKLLAITDSSMEGLASLFGLPLSAQDHLSADSRYVVFADARAHDDSAGPRHGGLRRLELRLANRESCRCSLIVVGCLSPSEYGDLAYLLRALPFIRLPVAWRLVRPRLVPEDLWQNATDTAYTAVSHRHLMHMRENLISHANDPSKEGRPALRASALWGTVKQWFQYARRQSLPAVDYLAVDGTRAWPPRLMSILRTPADIANPMLSLKVEQTAVFCETVIARYYDDISIIENAAREGLPGGAVSLVDAASRIEATFASLEEAVLALADKIDVALPLMQVDHANDRFL